MFWVGITLLGCQEFNLDPIDPDGAPPVQVAVVERFVQAPLPSVDILFVVDDTSSMLQELDALGDAVSGLLQSLESLDLDWQIGVVSADANGPYAGWLLGSPYVLTPSSLQPVESFASRMPEATGNGEAGFAAAVLALELAESGPNLGFRRPSAVLQVVFVSDADDASDAFLDEPVDDFLTALELAGGGQPARASALVGEPPTGCVSPRGAAQPGFRYHEVAEASGGRTESICNINFGSLLTDLGANSVALPMRFELDQEPLVGTVSVEIDGESVGGWLLDVASPAVVFDVPPPAGVDIEVRYAVREVRE